MSAKGHGIQSTKGPTGAAMPVDVFLEWLVARPHDARVAVAIDSDGLLAETELLGKPSLVDETGRDWQVVVFRGDDLNGTAVPRCSSPSRYGLSKALRGFQRGSCIRG